ncbi:MAG: protein sorting system archaetidylserine decarboxylase [Halobacteriales archaeon]
MQLAPGAYRLAAVPFLIGVVAGVAFPPAAVVGALLGVGTLVFFRDPDRTPPERGILSPADGTVSVIREEKTNSGTRLRVGVFMNVWHVHVNRAPAGGEVVDRSHEPGGHRPAFSKDAEANERVRLRIDADSVEYELVQIAGAFARRISPYVDPGDEVGRGDRIGHIAFGSRVDVLFPPAVTRPDLAVDEGDAVRAGETVLAREAR